MSITNSNNTDGIELPTMNYNVDPGVYQLEQLAYKLESLKLYKFLVDLFVALYLVIGIGFGVPLLVHIILLVVISLFLEEATKNKKYDNARQYTKNKYKKQREILKG